MNRLQLRAWLTRSDLPAADAAASSFDRLRMRLFFKVNATKELLHAELVEACTTAIQKISRREFPFLQRLGAGEGQLCRLWSEGAGWALKGTGGRSRPEAGASRRRRLNGWCGGASAPTPSRWP